MLWATKSLEVSSKSKESSIINAFWNSCNASFYFGRLEEFFSRLNKTFFSVWNIIFGDRLLLHAFHVKIDCIQMSTHEFLITLLDFCCCEFSSSYLRKTTIFFWLCVFNRVLLSDLLICVKMNFSRYSILSNIENLDILTQSKHYFSKNIFGISYELFCLFMY